MVSSRQGLIKVNIDVQQTPSVNPTYPLTIVIEGPTASGKSEVALHLAERLNGEVVSADSMQIYRGMDIGTAKLPRDQRKVPHHLIDIFEPGEPFSAQIFQDLGRQIISEIGNRSKVPVLCGGTGLYIQAVLEDMRFPKGDQTNNPIRSYYEKRAQDLGNQAVWEELKSKDPRSASLIHPNNVRRVIRALEMLDQGISYSEQVKNMKVLPEIVPSIRFGLHRDPAKLATRINERVDSMVEKGLVDEVKSLLQAGFRNALTAPQAIGYKEIVAYLDGSCSLDEAVEQIKIATRRYAKRQRTWLRRDSHLTMIDADSLTLDQIVSLIADRYFEKRTIG